MQLTTAAWAHVPGDAVSLPGHHLMPVTIVISLAFRIGARADGHGGQVHVGGAAVQVAGLVPGDAYQEARLAEQLDGGLVEVVHGVVVEAGVLETGPQIAERAAD